MFWGLIMVPQKRYTQIVQKRFHVSMAALDIGSSDDEPSQLLCTYEGRNYLLCTLRKPDMIQCSLDLNFEEGTEVSFATNGNCHVHLTGYIQELEFDDVIDEEQEDEEEVEDEEVEDEDIVFESAEPKKSKKRILELENGSPAKKKLKQDRPKLISSSKKTVEDDDNDSDDSDDSDVDLEKLLTQEAEEKSDVESEEESDDEIEEEEEDSSLSEEEEVQAPKSAKVNGVNKKQDTSTKKKKEQKEIIEQPVKQSKKNKESKVKEEVKSSQNKQTPNQKGSAKKRTLQHGVIVEDIKEGHGDAVASNGKFVHVYYEGRLKTNNKLFDKTEKGPGFGFRLGKGEVIKGWDIGLSGMKVGGKRRITCPPQTAYGVKGSPPVIPPHSTLIFEVELKKVS